MLVSRLVQRSNPGGAFCDRDHGKSHNVGDKLEQAKVHGRRFTVGSLTLYHCPNQTTITSSGDLSCEGGGQDWEINVALVVREGASPTE